MMRKAIFGLLSVTAGLLAGEDDWSLNSAFSFWGEYVRMRRMESNNQKLVVDETAKVLNACSICTFRDICETKEIVKKFGFEEGFRVGANYITKHTTWEAFYMSLHEWHGSCKVHNDGSLFFSANHPDFSNDFSNADRAKVAYTSHFQNAEFNFYRHNVPPRSDYFSGSWLVGTRYIHLVEGFDIHFTKSGSTSSYDINAGNVLLGAQVGGAIQWNPTKRLSWDFLVKGAGFYEWAKQKTFLGDFNNTVVLRDYEAKKHAWPFLVDVTLSLAYQLFDYMNAHFAYEFIYLNTVALASDQLVKHPGPDYRVIRTRSEIIIYGFYTGFTLSF